VTEHEIEAHPELHTTAGKLADFQRRHKEATVDMAERAAEKQAKKGRGSARQRIEDLLDEGSFVELDALARHRSTAFGLQENRPLGDGVITGYGTIDGRQVCVFSQDFSIFGGSLGQVYGEKITKVMDLAIKSDAPSSASTRARALASRRVSSRSASTARSSSATCTPRASFRRSR